MTDGSPTFQPDESAAFLLYRQVIAELQQEGRTRRRSEIARALEHTGNPALATALANLLTHCCFAERDFEAALKACRTWLTRAPDDQTALDSLLSVLVRLKRFEEVIEEAEARLPAEPGNERLHSTLANALSRVGRIDEARAAGNTCLRLKAEKATGSAKDLSEVSIPQFNGGGEDRNIIAFSLYGAISAYCDGAVRNAVAAKALYPEWRCRFYVDESVPARVTDRLIREGAQVLRVGGLTAGRFGTFWRFLVADDAEVDRYIVRDCDACLNSRERAAVDAWIASDRHFHVMRDGLTHTELMLAGMWGGVRGALPSMQAAMIDYCRTSPLSRTADQSFLRERVWPTVRQSVLTHDSEFSLRESYPFPVDAATGERRVGQTVTTPPVHWPEDH